MLINGVKAELLPATDRGLAIGADIEADVRVRAVMGSVARAADEIIGNALSYARSRIDVSVHREQAFGVLRVEDDGPGIPSAERSRVLQRFIRGSSAAPGGSGLGLALVAESATATGGAVAVGESALGGCSIEVRWPLAAS